MKRLLIAIIPLVILGGLVTVFALNIDRDPSFIPSVLINKPVPEFDMKAVPGAGVPGFNAADLKGHVSLVNVFASWCVACRDEHPYLFELSKRKDVVLYGLNQKDAPENAVAYLKELGNPYAFIGADPDRRVSIDWGVYGVPETFVVNKKGVITYKFTGPLTPRSIEEALIPAIEAANREE